MTKLLFGCIEYPTQCWGHVYCFCFWKLLFCCPMSQVALISLGQALSSQGQHQQFMSAKALLQKTWNQHQHFEKPTCSPKAEERFQVSLYVLVAFSHMPYAHKRWASQEDTLLRGSGYELRGKFKFWPGSMGWKFCSWFKKGDETKSKKFCIYFQKKALSGTPTYQQMQVIADCKSDVMLRLHLVVSNSLQARYATIQWCCCFSIDYKLAKSAITTASAVCKSSLWLKQGPNMPKVTTWSLFLKVFDYTTNRFM